MSEVTFLPIFNADDYNEQVASPYALLERNNLENRILWIDQEINENISLEYIKCIHTWNFEDIGKPKEDRKPIRLMIFSYGGSLDVCNAIRDTIKASITPIYGYNIGQADSAAGVIFVSCHKRYMFENSQLLIHKGSGSFSGNYAEVVAQIMNYQTQIENLAQFFKTCSSIPDEIFNEHFGDEWYVNAEEAVEWKLADKIIKTLDEVLEC